MTYTVFEDKYSIFYLLIIFASILGYTVGFTESAKDVLNGCKGDATVETLEDGKTLIKCSDFEFEL